MNADFRFMKDSAAAEMAAMLMDKRNMTFSQALDIIINSETYQKLSMPETGLYYQSPRYIFDYLDKELTYGRMA